MRICNFNASPNPAKLPKRSQQPQPFVPIRSIAVLPSFATLLHHHHQRRHLHRLSHPGFPREPTSFPLSPPSQNPITPRATSYVQQPNPHTRTRRALPHPRDQIDSVRVVFRFLFSDFFAIVKRRFACLSLRSAALSPAWCDRDGQIN